MDDREMMINEDNLNAVKKSDGERYSALTPSDAYRT
jgi:hypothetical protein